MSLYSTLISRVTALTNAVNGIASKSRMPAELPEATIPLAIEDVVAVEQDGVLKKVSATDFNGDGVDGIDGVDGATGPQGPQGLQGVPGEQGIQGVPGVDGAEGPQGIQGIQGDAGIDGVDGVDGSGVAILGSDTIVNILLKSGVAGDMWISTTTGADDGLNAVSIGDGIVYDGANWLTVGPIRGPQGESGADGIQGLPGVDGIDGADGAQGIQGIQGDDGAQGVQGLQGVQGVQGLQGETGLTGPQGETGLTGPQGDAGADSIVPGPQGIQGETGPQGEIGPAGADGSSIVVEGTDTVVNILAKDPITPNLLWIASDSGTDDYSNPVVSGDGLISDGSGWLNAGPIRGPQGEQGVQGVAGADSIVPGPTGPAGADGAQGLQGEQGIQGIQGIQGEQGIPGEDGAGSGTSNVFLSNTITSLNTAGDYFGLDSAPRTGTLVLDNTNAVTGGISVVYYNNATLDITGTLKWVFGDFMPNVLNKLYIERDSEGNMYMQITNESETKFVKSDTDQANFGTRFLNIVGCTQAEYDAADIAGDIDNDTYYLIPKV